MRARFDGERVTRRPEWTLAVSALAALIAAAARTPGAIRDAFWQDEVASARVIVEQTPIGMVRHIARVEATRPLWYTLGWIAHELGVSPAGFRWTSVAFGAVLAGLTVLLARRILPLLASGVAGLLMALGWQVVMHGRELRAYELFALLSVVFALALDAAMRSNTRRGWFLLVISVATGSLTNYFFLLAVVAGALWVWTTPCLRGLRKQTALAIGAGLVPLILWSPILLHQYAGRRFAWIGPFSNRQVVDSYWLVFAHHLPTVAGLRQALPMCFLLVVLLGSAALWRKSARGRLCALLLLGPFVLELLAWRAGARIFDTRNLLGTAPFAAIAVAAALARLPRSAAVGAAVAASGALMLGAVEAEGTPATPYQDVAHSLAAQGWNRHDVIVLLGDYFSFSIPLSWYLPARRTQSLAEAKGTRCPAVFVVAQKPSDRRFVLHSSLIAGHLMAGSIIVGRLRSGVPPNWGHWQRSHLLASTSSTPSCVEMVAEGRIVSTLRRS